MENKLPHIRAMYKRQTTPGNVAILLMLVWLVFPVLLDKIRKEPNITADIKIELLNSGESIITDTVSAKYPNIGFRSNALFDKSGKIICTHSWKSLWSGESTTKWTIDAFTGCRVDDLPKEEYQVCSRFIIESSSGRTGIFGKGRTLCSDYVIIGNKRESL